MKLECLSVSTEDERPRWENGGRWEAWDILQSMRFAHHGKAHNPGKDTKSQQVSHVAGRRQERRNKATTALPARLNY